MATTLPREASPVRRVPPPPAPPSGPPAPPSTPPVQRGLDRRRIGAHLVLAAALCAGAWAAFHQFALPRVTPATAPAEAFSAQRAVRHLPVIAAAPRPVASAGHAATREYLLAQISALGLAPQVQATATALRFPDAPGYNAGLVENIVVRLPGTASTGAIVLDAHYDGGATGPGAADCGACVVTLLETMRALRAGPPLRNDVIFVFTDAEEAGDLGAHAFATGHPWMRDVRLAMNFEAMGAGGPAFLYVTSGGNARLVDAFARAAPNAATSSFFMRMLAAFPGMRAACDLQDYLDQGRAGLGFIFTGSTTAYHTSLDNADVLDPRSVQHFGDYALGLTRHFGAADLATAVQPTEANAVAFNVWPGKVASYSTIWAFPLALAAFALAFLVLQRGVLERRISAGGIVRGLALFVASPLLALTVVELAWGGLRAVSPTLRVFLIGPYGQGWFLAGLYALGIATVTALSIALRHRVEVAHQAAGALAGFSLLAVLTGAGFPEASYVFLIPLVAATPAVSCLLTPSTSRTGLWSSVAAVGLATVIGAVVLIPAGLDPMRALATRIEGMSGLPLLGLTTIFAIVLAALVVPLWKFAVDEVSERRADTVRPGLRWLVPATAGTLALLLFGFGLVRSRFSAEHPRPSEIRYELDADRRTAQWVTSDDRLGDWTRQFIPGTTPRNPEVGYGVPGVTATFAADAPLAPLAPPTAVVTTDALAGGVRTLRVRLASPRAAPMLEIGVKAGGPILGASIAGAPLDLTGYADAGAGRLRIMFNAPRADGVELALRTPSVDPVTVELADWSDGLPPIPGWTAPRRPATTMPQPGGRWDGTRVRRTITLPALQARPEEGTLVVR